ncbi:MAG: hypothetical protein ACXQTL_02780 [Methanosarcinales archaeon]
MLSFIERLKDIVYEVEQTGGDPLELLPSPHLVQQLRAHALKTIEEIPSAQGHRFSGFLLEEFNEGFFDEGVRVSIIFLNRLGITDNERIEEILKSVVKRRILNWLDPMKAGHFEEGDSENVEDALITSVTEVWEDGGTEVSRAYTFAKQRALISWDYRENHWSVTNLGRFFLELNAFHATCFLLTVDICLSTGRHDFRHLSRDQLQNILEPKSERYFHLIPIHRWKLQWMGILSEGHRPDEISLTPLGKKALEYVLSENNLMIDTVILSLQAEEQGLTYSGLQSEIQKLEGVLNSPLIDDADRKSIQNTLTLCKRGQYLDGLKILFPCIEGVINKMLQEMGEQPDKYPGWKKKVDYLESKGVIPPDVAKAIEIITSRNKTLHGQFAPPDPEYAYPLFQMAIIYLHRILSAWSKFKGDV